MDNPTDELVFFVNGKKVDTSDVEPHITLAAFLRRHLGLTGAKQSCNEGSCGACTVMLSTYDSVQGQIRHEAATACLVPICTLHGRAVTTTEGIGNIRAELHPVQERIVKFHGTQCGFCTPGMVMSMYTLLRNNPKPTQQEIRDNLHGNICRCTGYRPIIDAFGTFAQDTGCCRGSTSKESCCQANVGDNKLTDLSILTPFDPTQELIFPPELQVCRSLGQKLICFKGSYVTWYRPVTLDQALQIKAENQATMIASGCTWLVQELKTSVKQRIIIDISGLEELRGHEFQGDKLCLGAGLSMTDVIRLAGQERYKDVNILQAIPVTLESWGTQLKAAATVGGHIMLRKPIYDLIPLLVAGNCAVDVAFKDGRRTVPLDEAFLRDPSPIKSNEMIVSLQIPCRKKIQIKTYKVAKRRHQSFASLSAAILVEVSVENVLHIVKARILFGGDIPFLVSATKTEHFLCGRIVTDSVRDEAQQVLESELLPPELAGFSETQVTWAQGFLCKCLQDIIAKENKSDFKENPGFRSSQVFEINTEGSFSKLSVVGQPLTHNTGEEQATGEAVFIDDMPPTADELFVYPVLSTRAYAKVTGIDMTNALSFPGVHGYIDAKDIPGINFVNITGRDEELLATDKVHYVGQMICGILAKNRETAIRAAKSVEVTYEDQQPAILSLKEAIARESFLGVQRVLERGDTQAGFEQSYHVLEGEVAAKGQKHFYLEMLSSLAVPKERNEMEMFCNTQMPHWIQMGVAEVLGVDANNVTLRVKRIGGGFGGKEVRCFTTTVLAAVAAKKFHQPVRCVLDCKDDTTMNGGRHPFLAKYKVGFTNEGHILGLEMKLYADGGVSQETTQVVLEVALKCGSTCYSVPAIRMEGQGCRTNLSSNGAFRGFGHPQTYWIMENIILRVAAHLSLQPEKIRELQLLQTGDITLGNMIVEQPTLRRCWQECKDLAEYENRVKIVDSFNSTNHSKKRGIAIQPLVFGIGFYFNTVNQGGALVNVYTDGSVMVTHGGCEMGQGLHTKIKQIASETLGIGFDKILVQETSTQLVPNATFTAGSVSTDLNGRAVHAACLTLVERVKPFRQSDPTGDWNKWVISAYGDRVSLSATGFAKVGDCYFNCETGMGTDALYLTYGAGCSEVEIDCLTGEHKVIRSDIVMDVGRSLNPAIDIGQIEGAFIQGYGYYMMEDVIHSNDGQLLTNSPMSYKVPLASDLPAEFNVALLKNTANDKGIYSSKGVGEPSFMLSLSTYLAAHKAVQARRFDRGLTGTFTLEHPATPVNVLKACNSL